MKQTQTLEIEETEEEEMEEEEENNEKYEELKSVKENTDNDLKKRVCEIILEHVDGYGGDSSDEDLESWLSDLFRSGCVSGMVGELISHHDTYKFFDKYYAEIMELAEEEEEETGEKVHHKDNLKNWYAWYGFEVTAGNIAGELEIEV